jgi:hypothetical protein
MRGATQLPPTTSTEGSKPSPLKKRERTMTESFTPGTIFYAGSKTFEQHRNAIPVRMDTTTALLLPSMKAAGTVTSGAVPCWKLGGNDAICVRGDGMLQPLFA